MRGAIDRPEAGVLSAKLRVLWLVKGLGPGGAERLLVAAAGAHGRSVVEIECAYLLPWKDHLVAELEACGVSCTCLDVRDERDVRWAARLRRRLRDRPVDVLHVHSPYPAAVGRLVARSLPRRLRPAVVSTEHNPWSTFKRPTRYANALTSPLDAATIAVSGEARASIRGPAARRAETLVHGIDVQAARAEREHRADVRAGLGAGPDNVLVGTVANYHPKKDWPNLLRAARLVADAEPRARFCLVGQGPLEAQVHALHRELALGDTVMLPGYRPDAVRLMAGCDIFVLASQWEGLPVALMEAMALGLPIVATAVGGVGELMRDGVDVLFVPPGDPRSLADAIAALARDPGLRARLGAAAGERAAELDVRRAVRRIEAVYESVRPRR